VTSAKEIRDTEILTDMLDYSLDVIFKLKLNGEFIYINKATKPMAGYDPEEMIGKKWMHFIPKSELPRYLTKVKELISGKKINDFQTFVTHKDGHLIPVELAGFVIKKNNRRYIVGVMRDLTNRLESKKMLEDYNEKLKQQIENKQKTIDELDTDLKEHIDRYQILFEEAKEAIVVAQDGKLVLVNPAFIKISGYDYDEIYKMPFIEFIHPDDRELVYQRYQQRLKGKEVVSGYRFRVVGKNKSINWLEIHAQRIIYNNKPATLNFILDITDKVEIEHKYQLLYNNIPLGLIEFDVDNKEILSINNVISSNFGKKPKEMVGRDFLDFIPKSIYEKRLSLVKDAIKTQSIISKIDFRDGKWFENTAVPIDYPTGKKTGLVIVRDITDLKNSEELLRESERKYRLITENSADIIYSMNIQHEKYTFVSPAVERLLGYTKKEAYKLSPKDVLTPESYSFQKNKLREVFKNQNFLNETIELEAVHKDGHIIPIEVHSSFVLDKQGKPIEIIGVVRDISDRIEIRRKLIQSEHKFREIFDSSTEAIFIHDPKDMRILDVNKEACKRFGFSKHELKKKHINDISEGKIFSLDTPENQKALEKILEGEIVVKEWLSKTKDGKLIWHEMSGKLITLDGKPRFVAIARDIRERKKAEEQMKHYSEHLEKDVERKTLELKKALDQLKNSEEKYRTLFEIAPVGIGIVDKNRNVIELNKSMQEMTGYYAKNDKPPKIDFDKHYFEKKDGMEIRRKLMRHNRLENYEIMLRRKNGELYPALLNIESITINKKPCWLTIERDISEIKQKEQEIQDAHSYLEKTINSATECIVAVDSDFKIKMYNKAFVDLIDGHKQKIKGDILKSIVEDSAILNDVIKELKKGSKTVRNTATIITSKKEKRLVTFTATSIGADQKNPEGYLFIGNDITIDASRFGRIRNGMGYIIHQDASKKLFDLMNFLQTKDYHGIWYSRHHIFTSTRKPSDHQVIKKQYHEIPFHAKPDMSYLKQYLNTISEYAKSHEQSFIVIERIDYLLSNYHFDVLMKWLYDLSVVAKKTNAILFIHLPEGMLTDEQLAFITAEFSDLPDQHIENIALEEPLIKILMLLKSEQEKNILVSYHHVGKHFKISKVTTKKRLDLLETKGLISIHEKGRMKIIKLTSKGETLLNKREVL